MAVLGAAMGAALGRSSIAEINPVYFREPESTRFFADLTAQGYNFEAGAAGDPQAFWTNELEVRPQACPGCGRDGTVEAAGAYVEAEAVAAAVLPNRLPPSAPPPAAAGLDRYMSFPINQEEAARPRLSRPRAGDVAKIDPNPGSPGEPLGM